MSKNTNEVILKRYVRKHKLPPAFKLGIIMVSVMIVFVLILSLLTTNEINELLAVEWHLTDEGQVIHLVNIEIESASQQFEESHIHYISTIDNEIELQQLEESHIPHALYNQSEDWRLILVNANNPLPVDFSPPLSTLSNGLQFDSRAIDQLNAMLAEMRNQGLSPVVASAHRSIARQTELFNNRAMHYRGTGLTQEQAEREAARSIARPGASEHNLGLAVDIVDASYQMLTDNQANTPVGLWLYENSANYGFILRYKRDTEHITGVIFEPWHFRYVGVEIALEITRMGITLEEFLGVFNL